MSIIRVSGGRNRGKINRTYGSKNYMSSQVKITQNNTEEKYYTNIIRIAKSQINTGNYNRYIKMTREYGKRLSERTLSNVLKAYRKTLSKQNNLKKAEMIKRISQNLEYNLKKYGVAKSTVDKILKYDPHYKRNNLKTKQPKKRVSSKIKKSNTNTLFHDNSTYFREIISFSYKMPTQNETKYFISILNRRKKILSDALIHDIVGAYKITLRNKNSKKQRKEAIQNNLEDNLLIKGVHPDTIQMILKLDKNYST